MTFKELYNEVVSEAVKDPSKLKAYDKLDKYQLDCLLYPNSIRSYGGLNPVRARRKSSVNARRPPIRRDTAGMEFDDEKCVGCGNASITVRKTT